MRGVASPPSLKSQISLLSSKSFELLSTNSLPPRSSIVLHNWIPISNEPESHSELEKETEQISTNLKEQTISREKLK